MKKLLFILCGLSLAFQACCQGTIEAAFEFSNFSGGPWPIAPVYGPEADNPHEQKWGNATNASPPGTQTYTGVPLAGTGYSVEAWYSLTPVSDVYALNSSASAAAVSQTTFPVGGGYFFRDAIVLVPLNTFAVYLQVRAWDNAGGLYGSWVEAWAAAQAGSGKAVGWSKVFWQEVATGAAPPPGMRNFESFNIFIVPEPSTIALASMGGLILMLVRRRRN